MKKYLCLLMSVLLCMSCISLFASAEEALPESNHNYENNFYGVWTYSGPQDAAGLLVTFSEDTKVERGLNRSHIIFTSTDDEITIGDFINAANFSQWGDYIDIFDSDGDLVGSYTDTQLAGQTVFVSGSSFTITLTTDASVTYYGFRVSSVEPCSAEEVSVINYRLGEDNAISKSYLRGAQASLADFSARFPSEVVCGYAESPDGEIAFSNMQSFTADFDMLDLYVKTVCPVLKPSELFSFNNSSAYFNLDGEDRYTMSVEDCKMLQRNLYKTFGPGPLPNPILSIVLASYPKWDWRGSCYGISAVTALQHLGLLDLLEERGAENVSELEPDEGLISEINYYQAVLSGSFLIEDKAFILNSPSYSRQLRYMFESVESGELCIFTFYKDRAIVSSGHTILLTAAYTDVEGNHIIIAYDSNKPDYYKNGYRSRLVISPDFKQAHYDGDEAIGAFNWTDDFTQFKAFDINGNSDSLSWYRAFLNHLSEILQRLLQLIKSLFGA